MATASPWWQPETEAELLAAATTGGLSENLPHLELKREIGKTAGANKELACDLASFAVDGGILLVGVVDEKQRDPANPASALHAVDLSGLPERVEQIALMRVDPPLVVRCVPIGSAANPVRGYLVVQIPPSAQAPHMSDGRYWGRGTHTKRALSDSDVVILHERRERLSQSAANELDDYVERDPWTLAGRRQEQAHLFIVCSPRSARSSMLLDAKPDGQDRQRFVTDVVQGTSYNPTIGGFAPDFHLANRVATRGDGWARTDYSIDDARGLTAKAEEKYLLEIELTEGGSVRVFCGRASDMNNSTRLLFENLIVSLTSRAIALAAHAAEVCHYFGDWALGVEITGCRGAISWQRANWLTDDSGYPDDVYRALGRASSLELQDQPGRVVDKLVGRLLRTLGSYDDVCFDNMLGR